jgi:hypothetical protein
VPVRETGKAFGRMREFRFSADVLNCDQAYGTLHTLINNSSDILFLLHGGVSADHKCPGLAQPARALMIEPNMSLQGD